MDKAINVKANGVFYKSSYSGEVKAKLDCNELEKNKKALYVQIHKFFKNWARARAEKRFIKYKEKGIRAKGFVLLPFVFKDERFVYGWLISKKEEKNQ